jgi:hypothetical protein
MPRPEADLYVDIDALGELARQLSRIKVAMTEAQKSVDVYDQRLGSPRLEERLDDFISGWKDGRKRIIEEIDGLLEAVEGSIDAYLESERKIVDATKDS